MQEMFFMTSLRLKVKSDHRSTFSNLSNWKEEAYVCLTTRCYTTPHLHQVHFSISLGFSLFFTLVFRTSNFWSWRNLIKQLCHSRLLDTRPVIANSALRASPIYHLISNARSWNNCWLLLDRKKGRRTFSQFVWLKSRIISKHQLSCFVLFCCFGAIWTLRNCLIKLGS